MVASVATGIQRTGPRSPNSGATPSRHSATIRERVYECVRSPCGFVVPLAPAGRPAVFAQIQRVELDVLTPRTRRDDDPTSPFTSPCYRTATRRRAPCRRSSISSCRMQDRCTGTRWRTTTSSRSTRYVRVPFLSLPRSPIAACSGHVFPRTNAASVFLFAGGMRRAQPECHRKVSRSARRVHAAPLLPVWQRKLTNFISPCRFQLVERRGGDTDFGAERQS